MQAKRAEPKYYKRVEFWVVTKNPPDTFKARTMTGNFISETDINRAEKLLGKYLDSRWPLGYSIKIVRVE